MLDLIETLTDLKSRPQKGAQEFDGISSRVLTIETFLATRRIETSLHTIIQILNTMDPLVQKLVTDVASCETVETSLEQLCSNIFAQLSALPGLSAANAAAIQALDTAVGNDIATITASVVANTPAAAVTPPAPQTAKRS